MYCIYHDLKFQRFLPTKQTIHQKKVDNPLQGTLPGPNHIAVFIQPGFGAQMLVAHRLVLNIFQCMCQGCLALTLCLWQLQMTGSATAATIWV